MGRGQGRNRAKRKARRQGAAVADQLGGPRVEDIAELAVDMWKVFERARSGNADDRVLAACERAEDRLHRIGFEIDTMVGRPYDTNLKVRVVDHDAGDGPLVIGQCIRPAVFYNKTLVREAEVVTKGRADRS